jgi:hypothetical protein
LDAVREARCLLCRDGALLLDAALYFTFKARM